MVFIEMEMEEERMVVDDTVSTSGLPTGVPIPDLLQINQQIFNYNLIQQLLSAMMVRPSFVLPPPKEETPGPAAPDEQMVIPNDDKEGWCRNKKYIEKVEAGFMCLLCRKVYGRYNSVSYHVTIYHRNPPIKCDFAGCDFTTREARYIHFHKYYRHGVELPKSIDQGSRRCPFCKHISKSPAMLEKHIRRHEASGWNDKKKDEELGRLRTASECVVIPDVEETKTRSFTL